MALTSPQLALCLLALTVGLSGLLCREWGVALWRRGVDLPFRWRPLRQTRRAWRNRWLRGRHYSLSAVSFLGLFTFQLPFLVTASQPERMPQVLAGYGGFVLAAVYADLLFGQREAYRRHLRTERMRRQVERRIRRSAQP